MTPRESQNALNGYRERTEKGFKEEWERVRWLGTIFANVWSKKKLKPSQLISFPWEKEGQESSPEAIEALRKEMGWEIEP